MPQIQITLPDGSTHSVNRGSTPADLALFLGRRLHEDAIAAFVNDSLVDLTYPLTSDATVRIVTRNEPEAHEILLHSTAHLMAQAVKNLYPGARIAIGPALDGRFYYDIDLEAALSDEMLADIEQEMTQLVKADYPVERKELDRSDALKLFQERGEDYKVEIIAEIDTGDPISTYSQNDFIDLCRGPHVPSTGKLKHFKLLSVSGAYWRGDEHNKMLQRIYGTAWPTREGLDDYLYQLAEAKRRDHRKLGQELDLFSFDPVSPASPFFHPKGTIIYRELENFIRTLYLRYGYQEVITPQIFEIELWKRSGHWEHYRDYMFLSELDDRLYGIKSMNCPGHTYIYASQLRSYRDLPLRFADFGRLHRYEKTGVLAGLTRVRSFAQDDAHIFCTPDQIGGEIESLFSMVDDVYSVLGFEDVEVKLSTRPEKFMGDAEIWDRAEGILNDVLRSSKVPYEVDPGQGAFYGPKIDYFFKDALKRRWQLTTIQLDFALPERFDLKYIDASSSERSPVMIHRAILGSIERFIAVYLEHTGGDFPLWLAPVQAVVLPISEKFRTYGEQVAAELSQAGIRCELDARDEKVGAKIRQSEVTKVPVMLIVGERETDSGTVAVRRRHEGDLGAVTTGELIAELSGEIRNKDRRAIHSKR